MPVTVTHEGDFVTVWRPSRARVSRRMCRQPPEAPSVEVNYVNVRRRRCVEGELLPVGRPRRRHGGDADALHTRDTNRLTTASVDDEDFALLRRLGVEGDQFPVRRDGGVEDTPVAVRYAALIRSIRVHDEDLIVAETPDRIGAHSVAHEYDLRIEGLAGAVFRQRAGEGAGPGGIRLLRYRRRRHETLQESTSEPKK